MLLPFHFSSDGLILITGFGSSRITMNLLKCVGYIFYARDRYHKYDLFHTEDLQLQALKVGQEMPALTFFFFTLTRIC